MCEYCEGDEYIVGKNGCASFVWMRIGDNGKLLFNTDANEYDRGEAKINYCPMCGRKLTNQTTAQQGKGKQNG